MKAVCRMYNHEKQGDPVYSGEPRRVQYDEISPVQSSISFPDNARIDKFCMLPDVYRDSSALSVGHGVQERSGRYRSGREERPIGARPLFVQHCYLDALMGDLLSDVVDISRCEQVLD